MASKQRELICDAAVTILASQGARALTHREVDRVAGLPQGSTSNAFRTRAALVEAVTNQLVRDDHSAFAEFQSAHSYGFPDPAGALAQYAFDLATISPQTVRARVALLGESQSTATTLAVLQHARESLVQWGSGLMSSLGVPQPKLTSEFVADLIDGAVIAAVTLGRPIHTDALADAIRQLSTDRVPRDQE